jgi:CheY-like chemotaxis protein
MSSHPVPPSDWPTKPLYRDLASASAAMPQALLPNVSMLAQDENVAEDTDSMPVPPPRSRRRRGQRRRGRGPQATILVVDDEEPVRETLVEVLSMQGYHVITAASVEQAEETKTQLGVTGIQLVITDVNLLPAAQAREGYAMAQRWRAMHPELPLILISGDSRNEDLPEVRDGSLGFLLKPFRLDALLEAVRGALGR